MKKIFYLPSNVLEIINSRVSKSNSFKYLYIIHKLCWYNSTNKDYYEDCGVKIHSHNTADLLGISYAKMSEILKDLIQWDIIIKVSGYKKGEYACSFKLTPEYESSSIIRIKVGAKNAPFLKSIVQREQPTTRIERKTLSILKNRVSLSDEGIDYIKSKYPEIDSEIGQIEPEDIVLITFYFREFFVKRPDSKSRLFTNLTSLKRDFKKYIQIDGKPILQTDLVNSQVVFGVAVLDKHFSEFLGEDYRRFKALSISGGIYEHLAIRSGFLEAGNALKGDMRKEFKQKFFREIWYSRNNPKKTKLLKVFQQEFPSVYNVINATKADDHADWPIYLQQAEAGLFIDGVLKELLNAGIDCLSIHDSIILNNSRDLKKSEEIIQKVFADQFGLKPKMKSEIAS